MVAGSGSVTLCSLSLSRCADCCVLGARFTRGERQRRWTSWARTRTATAHNPTTSSPYVHVELRSRSHTTSNGAPASLPLCHVLADTLPTHVAASACLLARRAADSPNARRTTRTLSLSLSHSPPTATLPPPKHPTPAPPHPPHDLELLRAPQRGVLEVPDVLEEARAQAGAGGEGGEGVGPEGRGGEEEEAEGAWWDGGAWGCGYGWGRQ